MGNGAGQVCLPDIPNGRLQLARYRYAIITILLTFTFAAVLVLLGLGDFEAAGLVGASAAAAGLMLRRVIGR